MQMYRTLNFWNSFRRVLTETLLTVTLVCICLLQWIAPRSSWAEKTTVAPAVSQAYFLPSTLFRYSGLSTGCRLSSSGDVQAGVLSHDNFITLTSLETRRGGWLLSKVADGAIDRDT